VNIAQHIGELLYEHECVVIPGFGGFIANDRSATVSRITHQFSPPFRKIMFNIHLSANDGLLINHIANVELVPYVEAKQIVDEFTKHYREELKKGNKIVFDKIGVLFKNTEGHIVFEQHEQVNYNSDAFGLGSFYSPAIERVLDEERLKGIIEPLLTGKSKPKDRKQKISKETGRKRRIRPGVVVLVLFLLLLSIGGGFTFKENVTDYWHNYSALIPIFNSEKEPYKAVNEKPVIEDEILVNTELNSSDEVEYKEERLDINADLPGTNTENSVAEEINTPVTANVSAHLVKEKSAVTSEIPDENRQMPDIKPSIQPYLIITGSFSKEGNAIKLVKKLQQDGINAMVADTSKNGMYRVAYTSFKTMKEAKEKLYTLRKELYPDAWILKK